MDIEKLIKELSQSVCIGNIKNAALIAKAELSKYAKVWDFGTLGVIGEINKGAKKTLLLDAHIDEVGFVVTSVFHDGFVKVSSVGGIDPRFLPATPIVIHGKKDVSAIFVSTPPHLSKGEKEAKDVSDIYLDTGIRENLSDFVSIGDFCTFYKNAEKLQGTKFMGKSLDDRCAVACLLEIASRIYDKDIPFNVIFSLCENEELGLRGAKTSAFSLEADEAIAIDVSFGDALDVPASKCGKLGSGAMIGVSPILSRDITNKLISCAEKKKIPYQLEVTGGATSTDADAISISKSGLPCGLISIPLRNMHTPCEVIDLEDIKSVCDILEGYILQGGAICD